MNTRLVPDQALFEVARFVGITGAQMARLIGVLKLCQVRLAAAPPQPEPAEHCQCHYCVGDKLDKAGVGVETLEIWPTAPDAHLREQIADAQARQAKGEGEPGDCELAHYDENHAPNFEPNNIVFYAGTGTEILRLDKDGMLYKGERVLDAGQAYTAFTNWLEQTKQNVAVESPVPVAPTTFNLGAKPAAPASTLPLSADEVNDWYCSTLEADGSEAVRKQALRAIELEQRCKEHEQFRHQHRDCDAMGVENHQLRQQLAEKDREIALLLAESVIDKERAEKAEAELKARKA